MELANQNHKVLGLEAILGVDLSQLLRLHRNLARHPRYCSKAGVSVQPTESSYQGDASEETQDFTRPNPSRIHQTRIHWKV